MAKKTRMPWGAGSVGGPDKNGFWELRVSLRSDAEGKARRIKQRVRAANKTAALAELERLRARLGLDKHRDARRQPSMSVYLASWLERKGEKLSPKTIRNYRTCASHIIPVIGHVRIDLLEHSHVTLLLKRLHAGCGERTVQAAYDTLRAALNYAVKSDRILGASPMTAVPRPSHYHETGYYNAEEARRFLAAVAGDRLRALFHLVVAIGLRRGEVLGLKWSDVDLCGAVLSVRRALAETGKMKATKTKLSQRTITLPASVVAELSAHRDRLAAAGLGSCALVFPSRAGTPLAASNLYAHHFLPAIQRAGLRRIRFHDLRHTAATIRLAAGVNPKTVQLMLGHTRIETTLGVYGHVVPSMQSDADAVYERLMTSISTPENPQK